MENIIQTLQIIATYMEFNWVSKSLSTIQDYEEHI